MVRYYGFVCLFVSLFCPLSLQPLLKLVLFICSVTILDKEPSEVEENVCLMRREEKDKLVGFMAERTVPEAD